MRADGKDDVRFEEVVWARRRDIPLRYALVSEEWDGEQTLWTPCADMDGLFVDRVPRRETLTLVGCRPTGRLLKAADRARREPVELGHLFVPVEFPDDHPDAWDGWWVHYWDLEEAVVVGSRPSALGPGLFDLVLEAEVIGPTTPTGRTGAVGEPESAEIGIHNGTGSRIGECRRIEGLYTERPEPEPEPLRLVGCEPTDRLLARLVHPRADGDRLDLLVLDRTGRPIRTEENLHLQIAGARPSRLGGALIDVDVTVRAGLGHRPAGAARPVWDAWYEGVPRERNAWAGLPTAAREEWLRFTTGTSGEVPVGGTCHLDGRFVTDVPGFRCALGEAVGGPGRHLHQCWGVLLGCPCGGEDVRGPFTLVWHDADTARRALAGVSVDPAGELPYVEHVVRFLEETGITVVLR
ncbi:hypothetical protein [Kitasatospora sp. NPDC007106]|uniref:hypothetical protein n=1 Tax=Kitasatospora sp. NPDC007106 TaxID=3156914 RepID=UPI00340FBAC2